MSYAKTTKVSIERTKAEIESLLEANGADEIMTLKGSDKAAIGFIYERRVIKFELAMPDPNLREFTHSHNGRVKRPADKHKAAWQQACRARWRGLLLVIKAKLEAVSTGVSTIELEFLPWTVVPGTGQTVASYIDEPLRKAIETGEPPRLSLEGPE